MSSLLRLKTWGSVQYTWFQTSNVGETGNQESWYSQRSMYLKKTINQINQASKLYIESANDVLTTNESHTIGHIKRHNQMN